MYQIMKRSKILDLVKDNFTPQTSTLALRRFTYEMCKKVGDNKPNILSQQLQNT